MKRSKHAASASPIEGLTQQRKQLLTVVIKLLRQIAAKDVTGHWAQLQLPFWQG